MNFRQSIHFPVNQTIHQGYFFILKHTLREASGNDRLPEIIHDY